MLRKEVHKSIQEVVEKGLGHAAGAMTAFKWPGVFQSWDEALLCNNVTERGYEEATWTMPDKGITSNLSPTLPQLFSLHSWGCLT